MSDITRIETDPRRSRAVVFNGVVSIGGQVADDRTQDITGQMQQVLAKIDKFLAAAGTDKGRLISAQIWVQNLDRDYVGMNAVWDAWTAPGCAPTRVTVEAKLAAADILVEVVTTAAMPV
ncbi:RidA family protein [Leptospira interrogans]